ncbi:hypothetical protein F4801DRAFT_583262 [Xylaria longipes]|nr:hypothetical protein F4801DRAFT_583262 [Xylaria longipes]RYC64690.1 hypothetical protein CHU98_g1485 [Xylaria longipes]
MSQRHICLRHGVWNGIIADARIKWNAAAKTKLAEYAREQGVEPSVLKGLSEHLIYQLAHKMGCKRAVIKSPPHEIAISRTNLNTGRMCDKLCMSGSLSSSRAGIQHVRIYLHARSALTKIDELEIIGEGISRPFGPSRAFTLDLDHSWGVGIEAWTGPTFGGDPLSSDSADESQSGMAIPEASPGPGRATSTAGGHCMNPEAAEFYPTTPPDREYSTQTHTWGYPSLSSGSFDTAFVYQYPLNMSPSFPAMLPPIGGYYGAQIDPWVGIPFAQNATQHTWNPYPQRQKYYNYGTQRWEPDWFDFPHIFEYA